jgi:hypothetical protein
VKSILRLLLVCYLLLALPFQAFASASMRLPERIVATSAHAAMASGLRTSLALAPPQFVSIPFRAGYLPSVDPVLPERPPSTLLA